MCNYPVVRVPSGSCTIYIWQTNMLLIEYRLIEYQLIPLTDRPATLKLAYLSRKWLWRVYNDRYSIEYICFEGLRGGGREGGREEGRERTGTGVGGGVRGSAEIPLDQANDWRRCWYCNAHEVEWLG